MTFSIGIRTVPRTPDYLRQLLDRLYESRTLELVKNVHISDGAGITPNENGCRALERAAADSPDWVLFFEDDMDVIDDLIGSTSRWLKDHEHPNVHLYPLGCNYSQCFPKDANFWYYKVSSYYQTGCFVLRADRVASLCDFMRERPPVNKERCFDLNIARWHQEVEPEQEFLLTPVPCFVDHLGEVSSMGCSVGRFAGFGGHGYSYSEVQK